MLEERETKKKRAGENRGGRERKKEKMKEWEKKAVEIKNDKYRANRKERQKEKRLAVR